MRNLIIKERRIYIKELPQWLTISSGLIFFFSGIGAFFYSKKNFRKFQELKKAFEEKYMHLSQKEKRSFTKDEYWVTNTSMWMRSRHLLWPLIGLVLVVLGIVFLFGISLVYNF